MPFVNFGSLYFVAETRNNEGIVRNEVSETPSTDHSQHIVEDSSSTSAQISEDLRKKNVSVSDVEALLHNALDVASGDHNMENGFSGNGEAESVSIFHTEKQYEFVFGF